LGQLLVEAERKREIARRPDFIGLKLSSTGLMGSEEREAITRVWGRSPHTGTLPLYPVGGTS